MDPRAPRHARRPHGGAAVRVKLENGARKEITVNSWRRWFQRKSKFEQDMNDELRFHIEQQTAANIAAGMPREEARRQAMLQLGAVEGVKEYCREERRAFWLESLWSDVRYGLRMLRKSPGFTIVAILTLALGIGVNTAIFSVVNGILLVPLVYADSSRLVETNLVSFLEFREMQEQCTAFERMDVFRGYGGLILGGTVPVRRENAHVSADFFPMLGVEPLLGRPILSEDTQPGRDRVAVLSYKLWMDNFGGDPGITGRSILMDGNPYTVIGVMPREFELGVNWLGEESEGAWTPLLPSSKSDAESLWRVNQIVARLKKGVTLEEANAELKTLSARLAAEYPKTKRDSEQGELAVSGVKDRLVLRVRTGLLILMGAVGIVLLMACVNVSALLVARAWTRQKEVAIRKALGATRLRIIRQLLSESVLLALAGGALGFLFSAWGIRALRAIAPPYTPRVDRLRLDGNVLWFTLGISLLAAILFGLAPALQISSRRMGGALKEGLGGAFAGLATRQPHWLRGALVVVEVALAVILVVGGALMARSFEKLMHLDTGVRTDHVLTLRVNFSDSVCNEKNPQACPLAINEVFNRIRSLAGVQRAAISEWALLEEGGIGNGDGLHVEGQSGDPNLGWFVMDRWVTPGYFETLGMRLLQGRDFAPADLNKNAPAVAVVSESFARMYIPGNPLGKRFSITDDKKLKLHEWKEIVGVVNDTRDRAVKEFFDAPAYYTPMNPGIGNQGEFILRTSTNPLPMAVAVQQIVWSVDKEATIENLETLDQMVAKSAAEPKFQTALLASFGVLALLLAVIGIYGVISYSVVQRTHEIGVRMALGARPGDVMRLVVGQGARLALVGIVLGIAGALGVTRFLQSMLFEVKPTDPLTFTGVAVLLLLVALLACYIPARRAMRVDPMVALRYE
jgi:predicted permease